MTLNNLSNACRFVRNAAPEQWDNFVHEFEQFTQVQCEKAIKTDTNIQLVQGFARQCVDLLRAFREPDPRNKS